MASILSTLRLLPRSDLAELIHVLDCGGRMDDTEDAATLATRVLWDLRRLLGLEAAPEAQLERHLLRQVANALGVDYDPEMDASGLTDRLRGFISDTIVEDLRPFIQVAVCMGWADGCLKPEEIGVVDAALSRLKLLKRRRSELLQLCSSPLGPEDLANTLRALRGDEQKVWSLLAFGWGVALSDLRTHPLEIEVFHRLASYLGVDPSRADQLRLLVTRRFEDSFGAPQDPAVLPSSASRALAKATMGAISAAELDSYLQVKTGLKALSLLVSSPLNVQEPQSSIDVVEDVLGRDGWVGAPTLLAGTLFLRRVARDPLAQKLLVTALLCLERGR
ncbi:MAG: hypothetical protein RBU30_12580 [Polyangia bacterium]|jgi:tellurite resistance protein|nr:hypothetical protein [Polyangia bacterium]